MALLFGGLIAAIVTWQLSSSYLWLSAIMEAAEEAEAHDRTVVVRAPDGFERNRPPCDVTSCLSFWDYLYEIPLFVKSIPKAAYGGYVVLQVEITDFVRFGQCFGGLGDQTPPLDINFGRYARAKVIRVERGNFSGEQVLLCNGGGPDRLTIGQTGYVYGTPILRSDGSWSLRLFENRARAVARRRAEGAHCLITFCFELPFIECLALPSRTS